MPLISEEGVTTAQGTAVILVRLTRVVATATSGNAAAKQQAVLIQAGMTVETALAAIVAAMLMQAVA